MNYGRYVVLVRGLPWAAAFTIEDAVYLALDGDRERGIGPVRVRLDEWDEIEILQTARRFPFPTISRTPLARAARRIGRPFREEGLSGDGQPGHPLAGTAVANYNGGGTAR